jgi:MFS family permease
LSTSPSPEQPQSVDVNLRRLFQISPSATLGCLTSGLTNGAFWSLAPVFTAGLSDDTSWAAWFMTSTVIGGALSQWPMGYLSDKLGRRKILLVAAIMCSGIAVTAVLVFSELSFLGVNLLGAAWGAAAFPLYAISVGHANDYAEADEYVMVSSGLLLMFGSGAIIGPFIASAIMALSNSSAMYVFTGTAHLLLSMYLVLRINKRVSAPPEQHIEFRDALTTAATASQVYEEEIQYIAEESAEGNNES